MKKMGIIIGHQPGKITENIAQHIRIGILLNNQTGRGMGNKHIHQPIPGTYGLQPILELFRQLMQPPATVLNFPLGTESLR